MKFYSLLLISYLLSNCFLANAQDPFVGKSFSSSAIKFENSISVCELPNSHFLFVGEKPNPDSTGFVFITDNNGIVIKNRYLFAKPDTTEYLGTGCYFNKDNSISVVGFNYQWEYLEASRLVWFARLDTNLNLIYSKENLINNSDTNLYYLDNTVQIGDAIYASVHYFKSKNWYNIHSQLVKMDKDGQIVLKRDLDSNFFGGVYSEQGGLKTMTVSADKHHLFFSSAGDGYITKIDTNFNLIDTVKCNPTFFTTFSRDTGLDIGKATCVEISPGNIIVGSILDILTPTSSFWGVLKYDWIKKKVTSFGTFPNVENKKFNNTPYVNIVSFGSSVFTLGSTTGVLHKNEIVVSKFDTNGHPIWIRYLGDNIHRFAPNSIYVCKDGSIIMNGYSDSATSPLDPNSRNQDFYIVRLDGKTGFPLSIRNVSEQLHKGISLYPNPGNDYVMVKGATTGNRLLLYNMLGQLVFDASVLYPTQSFNFQHLPSGTYSYQVMGKEAEKIGSGQWIKQQ